MRPIRADRSTRVHLREGGATHRDRRYVSERTTFKPRTVVGNGPRALVRRPEDSDPCRRCRSFCPCDATHTANPSCDPATSKNQYQAKPFSGLTVIDSYVTLGLEAALDARLSRWFRLRAAFAYARDQSHLITGDSAGVPSTPGAKVTAPTEYNPAYRPVIDQPGRRYLVDSVDVFDVKLLAQARF